MRELAALLAGASLTLALAPFNAWWWAPLPLALLVWLALKQPQHSFRLSLAFFIGYFASGSSWIYVSMHDHGNLSPWAAGFFTALFALALGTIAALPFRARRLWLGSTARTALGFPTVLIASEWLRSWLLTGFPWLYLGYSQTETVFGSIAPVFGVFGVSWLLGLLAATLALALFNHKLQRYFHLAAVSIALLSFALANINWTRAVPEQAQTIALVQGNIAQQLRWDAKQRANIKAHYLALSEPLWPQAELVIWPEAAVPEIFSGPIDVLDRAFEQALKYNSGLITGLPSLNIDAERNRDVLYNSVLGLGNASGMYHKQRLVPFGEYVPFADYLGPVFDLLRVPMSDFRTGPAGQTNMHTGRFELAADICYEVAYPALIAKQARGAGAMLTISNDAWFGKSIGPHQHLQMAQMRARENQRPMLRATNNGITAAIDAQGKIQARAPQFEVATLLYDTVPQQGLTPYQRWLNWPLLALMTVVFIAFRKVKIN